MERGCKSREVQAEVPRRRQRRYTQRNADDRRRNDGNEQTALHVEHLQNNGNRNSNDRDNGNRRRQIAKRKKGRFARNDNAAALQADKRDEQTDTNADSVAQAGRNSVHDRLTKAARDQDEDNHALEHNDGHSNAPVDVYAAQAQGISDDGVDAHARCQSNGTVGDKAHGDRHDGCADARCGKRRFKRHARCNKHLRVNGDDVRHRKECREAADDLISDRRIALGNLEKRIHSQPFCSRSFAAPSMRQMSIVARLRKESRATCDATRRKALNRDEWMRGVIPVASYEKAPFVRTAQLRLERT